MLLETQRDFNILPPMASHHKVSDFAGQIADILHGRCFRFMAIHRSPRLSLLRCIADNCDAIAIPKPIPGERMNDITVEAANVHKSYLLGATAVGGAPRRDLTVRRGEFVALMGLPAAARRHC